MKKLAEAFKGDLEFAYHRTKDWVVPLIVKNGFVPGSGDMYGKGWYMCYDLESQLISENDNVDKYGPAVIKCQIFDKGVLIFDYNVSKKVYGAKYTLIDQLLRDGIFRSAVDIPQFYKDMSEVLEDTFQNKTLSADIAYQCFVLGKEPKLHVAGRSPRSYRWGEGTSCLTSNGIPKIRKITAIVFSGNHDGNVVVGYSPNTVQPLEYAIIDKAACQAYRNKQLTLTDVENMFIKLDDYEIAEARSANARALYERLGAMRNSSIVSISILCEMTESEFNNKIRWIDREAKVTDAVVEIQKDGKFWFISGSWDQGTWLGDIFGDPQGSTYSQPVFRSGVFAKGDFYGNWEYGRFTGGSFKGYWRGRKSETSGGIWSAPASCWDAKVAQVDPGTKFTYEVKPGKYVDSELTPDKFFAQSSAQDGAKMDISVDGKTLNFIDTQFTGTVIVPPGIVNIRAMAFETANAKNVRLPDSVEKIGDFAFKSCKNLANINLPKKVAQIGLEAFFGCVKLSSINLPQGLTSIGNNAFNGSGLLAADIPDSVRLLGEQAFANSLVGRIKFPKGMGYIPEFVASNCSRLFMVELPQSLVEIEAEAFADCPKLKEIKLPRSLKKIGPSVFKSSGLQKLDIPEGVEEIGEYCFNGCPLVKVTLPKSLRSVGESAFKFTVSGLTVVYAGTSQDWMHIDFHVLAEDVFDAGTVIRCKDKDITIGD